jgi:eukaryotic-like serine/threonine-protein kinase
MMNGPEHSVRNLFAEALEITDPGQRAAFLDRACGTDASLRSEIEELLRAEADMGKFLPDQPAATASRSLLQELAEAADPFGAIPGAPITEKLGERIGRYELLEKIGEGGCGMVYLAQQETPVRRQVALKIIKLGMDTKAVVARFDAERQALAIMDHPNIAKVFDAGATDAGRPYFVMELARGSKITDYCAQHQLTTRQRLELFVQVCQAVQHAHQKGIVHRDLKPSNILVTVSDGVPVPKVIDFGIAKATEGKLTDQTLFTAFEQFLGTPAYMSPEQAAMTSLDIDTRSDIYSLGVLLYELLTGTTPFDTKTLLTAGVDKLRRIIREEEPPKPSTRLTQELAAARKTGRATRCAPPSSEAPSMRAHREIRPPVEPALRTPHSAIDPDLDWIVMKCLEKDRARRYATANGLAADLQRHLNNEPVLARPPSRLYEFQKTVRRHKVGFAATAAVIVALAAGLALATLGFLQARYQRDYANLRTYTADMNVVQQAWDEGNLSRAQDKLQQYVPKPGEPDLRGFEWRYLWKLCQDESRFSFTNFPAGVRMILSPDGHFVVAGSRNVIRFLDYANKRELDSLQLPDGVGEITALAFLPKDTNVLATIAGRTLYFWDVAGKRLTSTLAFSNAPAALAFSGDGQLLAVANGFVQTVELWRVQEHSLVWARGTDSAVFSLGFAPDGKALITGGGSHAQPLLWDLATGTESSFPEEQHGYIGASVFSPDGKLLATSDTRGSVILWDLVQRKLVGPPVGHSTGGVGALAFSPDGRWLATGSSDANVRLWDVAAGKQTSMYRGHLLEVSGVAFSPDGRSIISSSWDGTVKVWDVEPRSHDTILTTEKWMVRSSHFSPDDKWLVTRTVGEGGLKVWDVAARRQLKELTLPIPDPGGPGGISPDGKTLVSIVDRRIALWDAMFNLRGMWTNDFGPCSLSFTPDSRTLAVSGLQGSATYIFDGITNRLAFWDLTTQRKINKLPAAAPFAIIVQFSHDGKKLAIGYLDGEVRLWDYETERLLTEFKDQHRRIWSVAFSPDDKWLVAAGDEGLVAFYDLRTGRKFLSIPTSTWTLGLAFASDGRTLVSNEADGTVRLWNFATREIALTLKGHVGYVSMDPSFSRDGKYLVTTGSDGTVRLWEAATLEEIDPKGKAR